MRHQWWKFVATLCALTALSGCGGSGDANDDSAADAVDSAADTEEAANESSDPQEGDTPDDLPATTTTTSTTTTAAPPALSADEATDKFDDWMGLIEEYLEASYVGGDSTYDEAVEIIAALDPALVDGSAEDVAVDWHNCISEAAIAASAFYEITGVDIEIEHLEQTQIDGETWAVSYRSFVRLEGIPEQVSNETTLVTVDGVGPTIGPDEEDDSCDIPRAAAADELLAKAEAVLGTSSAAESDSGDSGVFGDTPTCEDVLAATPGTFSEGGCQFGGEGVLNLFGVFECGAGQAWVFDLDGVDGTWFGVEGGEWQELTAEQYTQDFIASQCA